MFTMIRLMKTLIANFLYSQFEVWWNAQESITNALHEDTVFTLDDINKLLSAHDTKEVGKVLANLWYEKYSATMDAYTEIDRAVAEYKDNKEALQSNAHEQQNQLSYEVTQAFQAVGPVNYQSENTVDSNSTNKQYTNRWAYHPTTGEYIDNMTYAQYEEIMWMPFDDTPWEEPKIPDNYADNFNQTGKEIDQETLDEVFWDIETAKTGRESENNTPKWILEEVFGKDNNASVYQNTPPTPTHSKLWKYDVNSWWEWWDTDKEIHIENNTRASISDSEFQTILEKYWEKLIDNDFIASVSDPLIHEAILRNYEIASSSKPGENRDHYDSFFNSSSYDMSSLTKNPQLSSDTLRKVIQYVSGRTLLENKYAWIPSNNARVILQKIIAWWPYTVFAHRVPWIHQHASNASASFQASTMKSNYRALQKIAYGAS